jgi:hypothetical protein
VLATLLLFSFARVTMMTLTERDNTNILDSLGLKRDVPAGSLFAAFGVDSRPDWGKGGSSSGE